MREIIIGTTPRIKYTFNTVDPSSIVVAKMTIKKGSAIIIEKTLNDATIDGSSLVWTLTQSDTLNLGIGSSKVMLNYLTSDGVRGASKEESLMGVGNHIREVIANE